jgi:chromosome partitioning protein
MRKVLVCSPKGGCGKTHLTRNLAVAAVRDGLQVATADLDPQEALTRWWQRRPASLPAMAHYPVGWDSAITLTAPDGVSSVDVLLIDTPPSLEAHPDEMRALIRASDLVLIPCRPSFDDIDSTVPYLEAVTEAGRRPIVVLNATKPRVNAAQEKAALMEAAELCPIEIADRADYARIGIRGLGICDATDHPGTAEVGGVWRFVRGRLEIPGGTKGEAAGKVIVKPRKGSARVAA